MYKTNATSIAKKIRKEAGTQIHLKSHEIMSKKMTVTEPALVSDSALYLDS